MRHGTTTRLVMLLVVLLLALTACYVTAPRDERTYAQIEADVQAEARQVAMLFGEVVETDSRAWARCEILSDQSGDSYYYSATVRTEYAVYEDFIDQLWPRPEADGWTLHDDPEDQRKPKYVVPTRAGAGAQVVFTDPAQERDVRSLGTGVRCVRPADY